MLRSLVVAAALFATPAFSQSVTVETFPGSVTIDKTPEIVAAYDVSAIDTLEALGVRVQGVVARHFVSYLDEAVADATPVGTLFEPDFEALAALQPDLVIVGGRSSSQLQALSKIAPTIDMSIRGDTVGQGLARLAAYGKLFGREPEAKKLAEAFNNKLERVKSALADKGNALILMTNGPKLSAYGSGGRFGWLHKVLGLGEAAPDIEDSNHGEAASFEFVRETNPDILLVIDRLAAIGGEGERARATLDNPLVRATNAWKNDQIVFVDPAPLYIASGGIQSMNTTLDDILAVLDGK